MYINFNHYRPTLEWNPPIEILQFCCAAVSCCYILVLVYYNGCVCRSRSDATTAINKIAYLHGRTNTAAALSYMYNSMFQRGRGDRDFAPNIVVILTDGASNNRKDTQKEAYKVRD